MTWWSRYLNLTLTFGRGRSENGRIFFVTHSHFWSSTTPTFLWKHQRLWPTHCSPQATLCFFTQTSLAKLKFCLDKLPSEKTPHTAIPCCSVKNLSWKEALNKVDLFNFFFFFIGLTLWPAQGGSWMTFDSLSSWNFEKEELKKETRTVSSCWSNSRRKNLSVQILAQRFSKSRC